MIVPARRAFGRVRLPVTSVPQRVASQRCLSNTRPANDLLGVNRPPGQMLAEESYRRARMGSALRWSQKDPRAERLPTKYSRKPSIGRAKLWRC